MLRTRPVVGAAVVLALAWLARALLVGGEPPPANGAVAATQGPGRAVAATAHHEDTVAGEAPTRETVPTIDAGGRGVLEVRCTWTDDGAPVPGLEVIGNATREGSRRSCADR